MRTWFWIIWTAILIVVAGVQFSAASRSSTIYQTNASGMSRQQIRQMPLLQRPNRPGHFYGNTVRRIHQRRVSHGRYAR